MKFPGRELVRFSPPWRGRGWVKKDVKEMSSRRKIIPYNPELKELARELRKNMTLSEVLLWNELKNGKMLGFDFDRQRPIDEYIVDFYCKELSLAIEIDGDTHFYRYEEDELRQKRLESLGVKFLRFDDEEVKKGILNVLRVIEDWIAKNKPTPNPSREGNQREDPPLTPPRRGTGEKKLPEGNQSEDPPLTPPGRGTGEKKLQERNQREDPPLTPPRRGTGEMKPREGNQSDDD